MSARIDLPNGRVNIALSGLFRLALTRRGKRIYSFETKNLIVSAGENLVTARMFFSGAIPAAPQYVSFGNNGAAAAKTQTALLSEFAVARVAAAAPPSFVTDNLLHLQWTYVPSITMANVSEMAVFNAAAAGTMISRAVLNPFTMSTTDSLIITWQLTFLGVD